MGSWWAHCIQKEGLKFDQKLKGIFWVILYEPWWARKRRLYYLWLLSGAYEPSKGFLPFLEGKSIISRKKTWALPEPPCTRAHVLSPNIIWGPGFWNVSFFYENPGLGHPWFSSIYITCVDVYLSLIFFLFLIFIEVKSEICEEHEAMQIHEPFFLKKGSYVQGGSENGRAHEPESEITFRLVSPSNLLRDMNAWALF